MWNHNKKRVIFIASALALGTLLTAGVWTFRSTGTSEKQDGMATVTPSGKIGTSPGDTAPDFQMTKMDGLPISTSDLKGHPSVLVFWTAWCPACKEEAPNINRLAAEYEAKGVKVLGINIKESEERTASGIEEFGIRYPVARDADAAVASRYNVIGTPTIIFLDHEVKVHYFGHELPDDYEMRLDQLLIR